MTRVLFFADTHLGLDWPSRPRVERRRRGDDFFANAERVVARALRGDVEIVIHGGDLFHSSRVPLWVAERGYSLLRRVADAGIPVLVVPGNHERSRLPFPLMARHPRLHVLERARTVVVRARSHTVALAGFPYLPRARHQFAACSAATGLSAVEADVKLLCVHQCFEGARVGTHDWVFRDADDVVRASEIPRELAAVLSGHVHRHQVLTRDLRGAPLSAPVLYPGSVERTSSAEAGEAKGFLLLDFTHSKLAAARFEMLPTRALVVRTLDAQMPGAPLREQLARAIEETPDDGELLLRVRGEPSPADAALLEAAALRAMAPSSMNVRLGRRFKRGGLSERYRRSSSSGSCRVDPC